jgi:hypothetical protein
MHLDTTPGEYWVDRIVIAIEAEVWLHRHAPDEPLVGLRPPSGSGRITARSSISRSAGTARVVPCTRRLTRSRGSRMCSSGGSDAASEPD